MNNISKVFNITDDELKYVDYCIDNGCLLNYYKKYNGEYSYYFISDYGYNNNLYILIESKNSSSTKTNVLLIKMHYENLNEK